MVSVTTLVSYCTGVWFYVLSRRVFYCSVVRLTKLAFQLQFRIMAMFLAVKEGTEFYDGSFTGQSAYI